LEGALAVVAGVGVASLGFASSALPCLLLTSVVSRGVIHSDTSSVRQAMAVARQAVINSGNSAQAPTRAAGEGADGSTSGALLRRGASTVTGGGVGVLGPAHADGLSSSPGELRRGRDMGRGVFVLRLRGVLAIAANQTWPAPWGQVSG
jgi:hypothetical protein